MDINSKEINLANLNSLPFSSYRLFVVSKLMSSRGLFFLSCNDVIYLDFHLPVFVHNLIIVKYDIKSKHAEEYSTANKEGSEKPLASRINHLLTFCTSQANLWDF